MSTDDAAAVRREKRELERADKSLGGSGSETEGEGEGEEEAAPTAKAPRRSLTSGSDAGAHRAGGDTDREEEVGMAAGRRCLVFLVEKKLSSGHLKHLRNVAARKEVPLTSSFR